MMVKFHSVEIVTWQLHNNSIHSLRWSMNPVSRVVRQLATLWWMMNCRLSGNAVSIASKNLRKFHLLHPESRAHRDGSSLNSPDNHTSSDSLIQILKRIPQISTTDCIQAIKKVNNVLISVCRPFCSWGRMLTKDCPFNMSSEGEIFFVYLYDSTHLCYLPFFVDVCQVCLEVIEIHNVRETVVIYRTQTSLCLLWTTADDSPTSRHHHAEGQLINDKEPHTLQLDFITHMHVTASTIRLKWTWWYIYRKNDAILWMLSWVKPWLIEFHFVTKVVDMNKFHSASCHTWHQNIFVRSFNKNRWSSRLTM
jgi:hypothetical protein